MKLQLVGGRAGARWVKLGMLTFLKQPLALAGLFFMFMAVMSLVSMLPLLGLPIAMTLLPVTTLGLMVATKETLGGKFPLPLILLSGLRAGAGKARAMLVLGALYAAGFLAAMGGSYLVDGGAFARLYLAGQIPAAERLASVDFQAAMWTFIGLHLPLSLLFWHAPALVFWQDLPPLKSMFFSIVACLRNFLAYLVFALTWLITMVLVVLLITSLASLLGKPDLAGTLLFPALLLLAAMFFTSLFFSYQACFELGAVPGSASNVP